MFQPLRRVWRPLAGAVLLCAGMSAAAATWTLDASTWARPRTGAAVLTMEPLPQVVDAWSRRPADRIVIHHPGGEQAEIWASELRDWLVALGIPGGRIEVSGGGEPEQLRIALR